MSPPAPGTLAWITTFTVFVAGSIRETLPSDWLKTHSDPSPTAVNRGVAATSILAMTLPRLGSTRYTLLSPELVTHTEPKPRFTTAEPAPTAILRNTRPLRGSTCSSVAAWPSALPMNHTPRFPTAMLPSPSGANDTGTRRYTLIFSGTIRVSY